MAKGKKMFLGGIQMFSVPVVKELYCHATELVYCQYTSGSEVGFSQ